MDQSRQSWKYFLPIIFKTAFGSMAFLSLPFVYAIGAGYYTVLAWNVGLDMEALASSADRIIWQGSLILMETWIGVTVGFLMVASIILGLGRASRALFGDIVDHIDRTKVGRTMRERLVAVQSEVGSPGFIRDTIVGLSLALVTFVLITLALFNLDLGPRAALIQINNNIKALASCLGQVPRIPDLKARCIHFIDASGAERRGVYVVSDPSRLVFQSGTHAFEVVRLDDIKYILATNTSMPVRRSNTSKGSLK